LAVIADTGPLNYLVQIGHADVLPCLFHEVVIPEAVHAELRHPRAPEPVRVWASAVPSWLRIRPAPDDARLPRNLGSGERAAIALARATGASLVIMDDRRAVAVARRVGLLATGTLGVLKRAEMAGLLNLAEAVKALQGTSFHVGAEVLNDLLADYGGLRSED
jgi:predicted nucleic acid-binding protein